MRTQLTPHNKYAESFWIFVAKIANFHRGDYKYNTTDVTSTTQWRNVEGLAKKSPLGGKKSPLSGAPRSRVY